jgi:hypothetical protein
MGKLLYITKDPQKPSGSQLVTLADLDKFRTMLMMDQVNQYTHRFNAARNEAERRFFAKLAISLAASVGPDIDRLLEIAQIGIKEFLEENDKTRGLQSGTRRVSNIYKLATELAAAADRL